MIQLPLNFSSLFNWYLLNNQAQTEKRLNEDLIELWSWLNANKIIFNIGKTEFIKFKTKIKPWDTDLRIEWQMKKISIKHIVQDI